MKNIWIIANWKSNKTIAEALDCVAKVGPQIPKTDNLKVVVCPAFSSISEIKKTIEAGGFRVMVGAQDLSPFGVGAYTGEEPAEFLSSLVDLAILGHSERRKNFKEDDDMIAKKVEQALANKITPLVCVQGEETAVPENCKLIAYEPIFAIGSGNPDTPENANKVAKELKIKYGPPASRGEPAGGLEVLYGGSVNSSNVKGFITQKAISGVLVGNASLDAKEFINICRIV